MVLRTQSEPGGVKKPSRPFTARERELIDTGNMEATEVAKLIKFLHRHRVPWIVENPYSSNLWHSSPFKALRGLPNTFFTYIDQCSCGTPWRKRTGLLCGWLSNSAKSILETLQCHGRGVCDFSRQRHIELVGRRMTSRAAEFPSKLCDRLVDCLTLT